MDKKIENKRLLIGCHLSSVKGFAAMGKNACDIDANTFAFFTRNPRGGKAKEIDEADVEKLKEILKEKHFGKLVAHANSVVSRAKSITCQKRNPFQSIEIV